MLRVKDWQKYQSYKDRKPPWIRLHKSLLDNFDFHSMSVNARALLPMLWLLASEDEDPVSGLIRFGYEKISFRLRIKETDAKSGILECLNYGFLEEINECGQIVTEPLRNRSQTVPPETETETETETESICSKNFLDFWNAFPRQRRGNKAKAERAYLKALDRASSDDIAVGLAAYACSDEVARGFGKGAEAWLNDDRWTHDYNPRVSPMSMGKTSLGDQARMAAANVEMKFREQERAKNG